MSWGSLYWIWSGGWYRAIWFRGGGGVVCVDMSGTEWLVLLRGVRLGGVCVLGRMVRMAVRVGVSCSICRVGVLLVCAGVVSGWNAAFCSMP